MRARHWTTEGTREGGREQGVVYYSGETGWGEEEEEEEEEDTRGKAAYADNALCLRKFRFHWWTSPAQFMASINLFIWTNNQIGALMSNPGVSVAAISVCS